MPYNFYAICIMPFRLFTSWRRVTDTFSFFVVALYYTAGIHYILEGHDTCYLALGLDLYTGLYPVPLWRFLGEVEVWRTFGGLAGKEDDLYKYL